MKRNHSITNAPSPTTPISNPGTLMLSPPLRFGTLVVAAADGEVVVAVVETAGELLAGVVLAAVGEGVAVVLTLVGDVLAEVDVGLLVVVLVLVVLVKVVEGEVDVTNVVVVVDAALEKLVVALAVTDEAPVVEATPVTPEIVKRAE